MRARGQQFRRASPRAGRSFGADRPSRGGSRTPRRRGSAAPAGAAISAAPWWARSDSSIDDEIGAKFAGVGDRARRARPRGAAPRRRSACPACRRGASRRRSARGDRVRRRGADCRRPSAWPAPPAPASSRRAAARSTAPRRADAPRSDNSAGRSRPGACSASVERVGGDVGIAVAVAADPVAHAEEGRRPRAAQMRRSRSA